MLCARGCVCVCVQAEKMLEECSKRAAAALGKVRALIRQYKFTARAHAATILQYKSTLQKRFCVANLLLAVDSAVPIYC